MRISDWSSDVFSSDLTACGYGPCPSFHWQVPAACAYARAVSWTMDCVPGRYVPLPGRRSVHCLNRFHGRLSGHPLHGRGDVTALVATVPWKLNVWGDF